MKDNLCGYEITHNGDFKLSVFHKQQICNSLSCGFKDGEIGFGSGLIDWEITKVIEGYRTSDFIAEMESIYGVFSVKLIQSIRSIAKRKLMDKTLSGLFFEQIMCWTNDKISELDVLTINSVGDIQEFLRVSLKKTDFEEKMTRKKLAYILNKLNPYMERPFGCKMTKSRQIKHIEHWMRLHRTKCLE